MIKRYAMADFKSNTMKRCAALGLCLAILVVTLFSFIYIAHQADHDCNSDHCPVCTCIHTAKQILRQVSSVLISFVLPFFSKLSLLLSGLPAILLLFNRTPVCLKTRMNH